MERFSERLQELRKEKNATKEDLAAHLGITVRAYRYYEEGKRYPDFQGLIALADYFGVTLDDLVGRTAIPSPLSGIRRHPPPVSGVSARLSHS